MTQKGESEIAIYHLHIQIVSRGQGKSAVAAAAYRAGEKITNQYDGIEHDYTRKGGVVHTEILLPDNAPAEYQERAVLWNAVEKSEAAKNAQLAREIEVALPKELTLLQNKRLVRRYVEENFVSKGMCADIAIHDKKDGNAHAHILLTMRPIERGGEWGAKSKKEYITDENGERIVLKSGAFKTRKIYTTDWNEPGKAEEWRGAWADMANLFLEKANHAERIDHRSYERQGIKKIPTIHLGTAAAQMERRGIRTERGNVNREIAASNQTLRKLRAQIVSLQKWLKEEVKNTEPPALVDVIQGILSKREHQGRYQKISNLKSAAKMLNFLTENSIKDLAGLREKVAAMYERYGKVRDALKKAERRASVLDEHIRQSEIYLEHRALFKQYQQMPNLKKREAFYESHRAEIVLCETAREYLAKVLNGRIALPIESWRAERVKLATERSRIGQAYALLKEEVREVEQIRKGVDEIMREEQRRTQSSQTRVWGTEL